MSCEACRTIPPVIAHGYTPKGTYETIAGLKTYITGPRDASAGIVDLYDIFGLASQTLQGADILASRLNVLVLVPDFFKGACSKLEWFPPDTEEKKQYLNDLISNEASIPRNLDVLLGAVRNEYPGVFPSVKKWAAVGLCWGGKVTALASGPGTPFTVSGQVHPGRMERADAEKISIPHIVLASKDEPAYAIKDYTQIILNNGFGGHVETYTTMWHGWMGARANLDEKDSAAEYIRGYTQIAEFFEKYLQ